MKRIKTIRTLATTFSLAIALTLPMQLRADEYWNGGSGTWDFNTTPNWNAGTWNVNDQAAVFNSTPGVVTVDNSAGQVGDQFLQFGSGSTAGWDVTGGDLAVSGNSNLLVVNYGNGPVTIDSNMNVDTTRATDRYNIYNNNGTTINLNGNITFGAQPYTSNGNRSLIIGSGNNNAVFNINGTFSDSSASGGPQINLRLAEGGATFDTYNIYGDISGLTAGLQIGSGNVVIHPGAVLNASTIGMYDDQDNSSENVALLTAGGRTIANNVYISMKYHSDSNYGNGTFGGTDATSSAFTGSFGLDNSGAVLTAASGGRVTFSGGSFYGHSPNGLFKTGAGTVVMADGNSYGLNNDFSPTPGTVAFEVKQGTLLIENPNSTSAFGNNSGIVNVDSGAKLGGNGYSPQQVVVAAGGIIAPGDAGQSNLGINPSIATLHLTGGLSMASGATLSFKLAADGASNDMLDLGAGALTLSGTTNVDVTALGTVNVDVGSVRNWYVLATGTGTWTTNPTFDITAPAGYVVDHVNYDPTSTNHIFEVDFLAVPEPSTYALMIGGLAFLGFCVRRKNRMV